MSDEEPVHEGPEERAAQPEKPRVVLELALIHSCFMVQIK
jgi:hypothetical protein